MMIYVNCGNFISVFYDFILFFLNSCFLCGAENNYEILSLLIKIVLIKKIKEVIDFFSMEMFNLKLTKTLHKFK